MREGSPHLVVSLHNYFDTSEINLDSISPVQKYIGLQNIYEQCIFHLPGRYIYYFLIQNNATTLKIQNFIVNPVKLEDFLSAPRHRHTFKLLC